MSEEPPFPIVIRRAQADDVDILVDLCQRTYRQHFTYLWAPANLKAYLEKAYSAPAILACLKAADCQIWLAEAEGEPLGYLMLQARKRLPGAEKTDSEAAGAYLQRIYVLAEHAGRGVGSRMMKHAVNLAEATNHPYLWLQVMQSSYRSIAFYRHHGFQIAGETIFDQFPMRTEELSKMYQMKKELS